MTLVFALTIAIGSFVAAWLVYGHRPQLSEAVPLPAKRYNDDELIAILNRALDLTAENR
jgi:hypothetical protein